MYTLKYLVIYMKEFFQKLAIEYPSYCILTVNEEYFRLAILGQVSPFEKDMSTFFCFICIS